MLQNLTRKLTESVRHLFQSRLVREQDIRQAIDSVKKALIDADVALDVAEGFISKVKLQVVGLERMPGSQASDQFHDTLHRELINLLKHPKQILTLSNKRPHLIALVGLQGAGKTTTAGKLANYLKNQGKQVALASIDRYRAGAILQLSVLAEQCQCAWIDTQSLSEQGAVAMATHAWQQSKKNHDDVLIVDFAGRHQLDDNLMAEAKSVLGSLPFDHTLFTVDAMLGQSAAQTAKAFHEALPLSGIILTKLDADSRGGAALSVTKLTQCPILFVGNGEKIDDFDHFSPENFANRLLDQGDLNALIAEAKKRLDPEKAKNQASKMMAGHFDYGMYLDQLKMMQKMGGVSSIMAKLPGAAQFSDKISQHVNEEQFNEDQIIIQSMTSKERQWPDLLNQNSRVKRIAQGSGKSIKTVKTMMKRFDKTRKMVGKMSSPKIQQMMLQLQNQFGRQD